MDPVEKAIRNALAKGDAGDAAFRLRVYQAARNALDRAVRDDAPVSAEQMQQRRIRLSSIMANVEAEFAPAAEPPAMEPDIRPAVRSDHAAELDEIGPAPVLAAEPRRRIEDEQTPRQSRVAGGLGKAFARIFVFATVLALVVFGGWWAYDTGLFKSAAERDTSVPNPPAQVEGEDFTPKDAGAPARPGDANAEREWMTVFSPADPSTVQASEGAKAEIIGSGDSQAIRVASSSADASVTFDVGEGILERLAGGKAVFDVIARSEEGKATQISITCDFAGFGDCGRKRYEIGYERGEYLFEIAFPQSAPGGAGSITIVSDLANAGKAVEIFLIRASPAKSE